MTQAELEQEVSRPPQPPGILQWIRENLFNGIFNSILTIVLLPFVVFLLYQIFNWVLFTDFPSCTR
jgi:general L-amino acid transport system permease protein